MSSVTSRHTRRRSSRIQVKLAVLTTALDPAIQYSEVCEASVINAHGCALRSPKQLQTGTAVRLRTKGGGQTRARVVSSQFIASTNAGWMLGVSLDSPGNFWGLRPCPVDWLRASDPRPDEPAKLVQPIAASLHSKADDFPTPISSFTTSATTDSGLTRSRVTDPTVDWKVKPQGQARIEGSSKLAQDLRNSENDVVDVSGPKQQPVDRHDLFPDRREQLSAIVAELIQPLQSELETLREKAEDNERKTSGIQVALAQLPSDVEHRLWSRVRQHVEADIAKQTADLHARSDEIKRQLGNIGPHDEEVINSLRNLSTRIDAVSDELQTRVEEQTNSAQQGVAGLADKIEAVARIAGRTSEQLAGISNLVRAQIADQQDQLSTIARKYAADIEGMKQFRVATTAALQQLTQMQAGFSNLCDEVSQIVRKQLSAFREEIERQISQRSEETLTTAKTFFAEQGGGPLDLSAASAMLQEIEATGETLKARLQKTTADAQQHLFAIFEQHMSSAHDEVRKWISDEIQAFDRRTEIISADIAGSMRQEIGQAVSQEREGLRAWLEEQKQDLRNSVHGAALEASAELKAKHQMNLEMATNSGQNLQQEMVRELQQRAACAAKQFGEQVTESLDAFGRKLDELVQECVTRSRLAVVEDLRSVTITLDTQIPPKP